MEGGGRAGLSRVVQKERYSKKECYNMPLDNDDFKYAWCYSIPTSSSSEKKRKRAITTSTSTTSSSKKKKKRHEHSEKKRKHASSTEAKENLIGIEKRKKVSRVALLVYGAHPSKNSPLKSMVYV